MENNGLHIGSKAPEFVANSTVGSLKMSDYKGKWVVLFSHPGDFTPVCTTEFIAFAEANEEFAEKNAQLIGLSIDSNPSHLAWVYTIYQITGIKIPFPVIADRMGDVARLYGMIAPDVSKQETVRNVFIIDPEQIIRAILVYPMTNGRNSQEILRLLTALQTSDEHKVVTPANWQPGQPTMVSPPQTYEQLISRNENAQDFGLECKDWFWCYNAISPLPNVLPTMAMIEDSEYNLKDLIRVIENLERRIESITPAETRQEQYNQFLMFNREIDQLDDKIDLLMDQVEANHLAGKITREEYRNIEQILDSLDDRLDRAEDMLKYIFGMEE